MWGLSKETGKKGKGCHLGSVIRLVTAVGNWGSVPPVGFCVECASKLSARDIEIFIS